ncbi:MAG: MGMT family protein [Candidatus Izemoplasma sp.]
MTEFTIMVLNTIKSIPKGKVMTYGQIAAYCDNPRNARGVSRILHGMSRKHDLPWHRVINSRGTISLTGNPGFIQKELLEQELIIVDGKKIDLNIYLYRP